MPPRSDRVISGIFDAMGRNDPHVEDFAGFRNLTSVEYAGFLVVLADIYQRGATRVAEREVISQVLECCGPFMSPGGLGVPTIHDLKLSDGVFAVLSPDSVRSARRRFKDAPVRAFRPLYESSPALEEWVRYWASHSPEVEFDDFLDYWETWEDLLDRAQSRSWGALCYM